jgi:hypothetical protein
VVESREAVQAANYRPHDTSGQDERFCTLLDRSSIKDQPKS